MKNYRPVSNIAFIGKVIEKVVAERLIRHMNQNNLNEQMQSAYRAFHSTETALTRIHNDILLELDKKKSVLLCLLDLSSAFDTIDHQTLYNILSERLGIKGTALQWFRSYLSQRTQSVTISGDSSASKTLRFGVPQGSVLGPLLYTIYTLPIGDILRHHDIPYHLYADDSQIYLSCDSGSFDSLAHTVDRLQQCVSSVKAWMIRNKLKLNDDKTEIILITSPYYTSYFKINEFRIDDTTVTPVKYVKNIGVYFDNNMNMKKNVDNVCKTVRFHLRNIGRIRKHITKEACESLVHSLVSSRIDYANTLHYGVPDSQIKRLQRLFNIAARIVTLSRETHITPILKQVHWLPVKQRISYKLLLLTFKALHGIGPSYLSELLVPYLSSRSLRSSSQKLLVVPKTNCKSFGDRSFSYAAPLLWNSLPLTIRYIDDIGSFKTAIKTLLFSQAY